MAVTRTRTRTSGQSRLRSLKSKLKELKKLRPPQDFLSPGWLRWFKKASALQLAIDMRSKHSARDALVRAGIYTKNGNLTKHLR